MKKLGKLLQLSARLDEWETYHDDLLGIPRCVKQSGHHSTTSMSLDEMIKTIIKAGYEARKNEYPKSG